MAAGWDLSAPRPAIAAGCLKALLLGFASTAAGFSSQAWAEDSTLPFSGSVKLMSNYVGRGLSQSVGRPSVAGELKYEPDAGLCAEIDGYSINVLDELYPGDSASLLLEAGVAYRLTTTGGARWQGGVQRVQFPGRYVAQPAPMEEPNTTEAVVQVSQAGLSAKLDYALTDYYGTPGSKGSGYLDLAAALRLDDSWALGAHLGRKQLSGTDSWGGLPNSRKDYTDYKLSLSHAFGARTSLTLAYTWTNANPALYTVHGYNVAGNQIWLVFEKEM